MTQPLGWHTKSVDDYQERPNYHTRLQHFQTNNSLQTLFSLISIPFFLSIIAWYSPAILVVVARPHGTLHRMLFFFQKRKLLD